VSGDMIDGTIVVRLLERRDPSAVADRRLHGDLTTPGQSVVRQTDKGHRELTW
jgi:3-oxoacyl-[acyl-carrier protein] reductase